jgi:membrane-bound lytic murein transglycosylase B
MSQSLSSRRPVLRALVAGAALSALSFPALSLAAKKAAKSSKRRVAVHEEEIDPDRYRNNPQTQAFIGMLVAQYNFDRTSLDTLDGLSRPLH